MCGIAGFLSSSNAPGALDGMLPALLGGIRHRGPDAEGTWVSPGGEAGFAHSRLAIIDLSPAGRQPMHVLDGRYTIVFNGEIYNHRALAAALRAEGMEVRTQSDTEIIPLLWHLRGPAGLRALRGMFAFALWDHAERSAVLARDPLGIKPLYYAPRSDGSLAFASELRVLVNAGIVPRALDPQGLAGFLQRGSVPEPRTLLAGARCLEAGHCLRWRAGKTEGAAYWQLPFGGGSVMGDPIPAGEETAWAREALLDSVRRHFVSDVPVGLFLSGGLDSTALLALSRAAGHEGVRTYSISFEEREFDEGAAAARTAAHFGARHTDFRLGASEARGLFDRWLARLDQPSVDGFNTFAISRVAHDDGAKVVLSGLGGDELLRGYPSFERVPAMLRAARRLGPLRGAAGRVLRAWPGHPRMRRLGEFFGGPPTVGAAMTAQRGIFTAGEARALAAHFLGARDPRDLGPEEAPEPDIGLPSTPADDAVRDAVSAHEVTHYMRNQLLRDSDVASMAWALELRTPLVDAALFEALARIPPGRRLRPGKALLLAAVPEVPEWIAGRPKRGFSLPFERWLTTEWRGVLDDGAPSAAGVAATTWYQRGCLFVLRRWMGS